MYLVYFLRLFNNQLISSIYHLLVIPVPSDLYSFVSPVLRSLREILSLTHWNAKLDRGKSSINPNNTSSVSANQKYTSSIFDETFVSLVGFHFTDSLLQL